MLHQLPRQLTEFPDVTALDYREFNQAIEVRRCGFDSPGAKNAAHCCARMAQLQREALKRHIETLDHEFQAFRQRMLDAIDHKERTGTWPDDDTTKQ